MFCLPGSRSQPIERLASRVGSLAAGLGGSGGIGEPIAACRVSYRNFTAPSFAPRITGYRKALTVDRTAWRVFMRIVFAVGRIYEYLTGPYIGRRSCRAFPGHIDSRSPRSRAGQEPRDSYWRRALFHA
jgi:hypothetical protein